MIIQQQHWTPSNGWQIIQGEKSIDQNQFDLILAFGERDLLEEDLTSIQELRTLYPHACLITCSSSGEILRNTIYDHTITATAIAFESTKFKVFSLNIKDFDESVEVGKALASMIPSEGLGHIFVLSDGIMVNGSTLVQGLDQSFHGKVPITGGLAGDSLRFERTLLGIDDDIREGNVVAIAFYGERFHVGYGTIGGWDSFGPDRVVTKSEGNVLYELDGKPALGLYKQYLDDLVDELPGSALLFPLSIRSSEEDIPIVRTILAIDEAEGSMTFAGDIPQGSIARLMKANFDRLIDGASVAAEVSAKQINSSEPDLAILISCVGRKVVLAQRAEEEVEAVNEVLGNKTVITGFYSNGEISPLVGAPRCELHNQTMTITTFAEG